MFRGAGTALNAATVLVGSGIGLLLGHRLPERTRDVVTDGLGLVTLLVASLSAASVTDRELTRATGSGAPVLVVLGSVLLGGIAGSLLHIERRLEGIGERLRRRVLRGEAAAEGGRARFVEGYVSASLLFCVGPLTVLGSLDDGLGHGIDKLALKSVLDGFASIAFAASLGVGVALAAVSVVVVQGTLTALAAAVGSLLPPPHIAALTATGGLLLAGVGLRLLRIRMVPVADLLPALAVAPLLTEVAVRLHG